MNIVNLYYDGTAQWKAHQAVERRLTAIKSSVGPYRPILESNMSRIIKSVINDDITDSDLDRQLEKITSSPAPDIDEYHNTAVSLRNTPSTVDSDYLHRLVAKPVSHA